MRAWDRRSVLAGTLAAIPMASALARAPDPGAPVGRDDPRVDAFVKAEAFQGVILAGRRGKPVYARAFGMADIEAQKPATVATRYAIASISKWLTALAVLRLVEQGRLALDAPIGNYLPAYSTAPGARVTLRQLLSNTSGIPNLFSPQVKADPTLWGRKYSTAEAVRAFCTGALVFEPGARFSYDFTNWVLVKAVVEAVTGQDFADVVRMLTLVPLGMTETVPSTIDPGNAAAVAYSAINPPVRKMFPAAAYTLASGGYVSGAADLLRASHRVFGEDYLSRASLEALTTVIVPEQDYALGGRVKTLLVDGKPRRFAWETGRRDGYRSLLAYRLDDHASLILLNNTDMSQRTIDEFGYRFFGAIKPA